MAKIIVTKLMGGDKFSVDDPSFNNGEGRMEFRPSKQTANALKTKWLKEYGQSVNDGDERNSKQSDGSNKSDVIRQLVEERVPLKQVAQTVGCRYQMAYNIAKKHLDKTGMWDAYWRDVKSKQAEVSGEPDAGTEEE